VKELLQFIYILSEIVLKIASFLLNSQHNTIFDMSFSVFMLMLAFQACYTTVFGVYSAFLFLRTGQYDSCVPYYCSYFNNFQLLIHFVIYS